MIRSRTLSYFSTRSSQYVEQWQLAYANACEKSNFAHDDSNKLFQWGLHICLLVDRVQITEHTNRDRHTNRVNDPTGNE